MRKENIKEETEGEEGIYEGRDGRKERIYEGRAEGEEGIYEGRDGR